MPGLYTGATGLWGGFSGLLYGTALSTPPGLLADAAQSFSPLELFATGAPGVWYDSSDFSTMFQDATGTTPVTAVEQPVGLRLDKSRGLVLGSELFTNGDFSNGTTGWTATGGSTFTVSSGRANWSSASGAIFFFQNVSASTSKYYEMTVNVVSVTGTVRLVVNGGLGVTSAPLTTGVTTVRLLNSSANGNAGLQADTAFSIVVESISIRELPGSHAFQTTDINRPVLSARYNLLTYSETLTNAVWASLGGTIASSVDVSPPSGVTSIFKLSEDSSTGRHLVGRVSAITVPAGALTVSAIVRKIDRRYVTINFVNSTGNGWFAALFDLDTGTYLDNNVASVGSTQTFVSGSISSLGDSWYRISVNGTTSATSGFVTVAHANAATYSGMTVAFGNPSFAGVSGNASYVSALDLRVSNDGVGLPAYQRVTTATDYDTTGFPLYLRYNGTNSTMQTASIDFTSTAAMSVFAGVRKLSDAQLGLLLETSADASANQGAFYIAAPDGTAATTYQPYIRATTGRAYETYTPYAAPITNVLSALLYNRLPAAGEAVSTRINGSAVSGTEVNSITSAGNFGNYPLYLGARAGSSFWFYGRDYGLIVLGRTATATEIANTEDYMEVKTFGKDMAYVYTDPVYAADGVTEITAADGDPIYMTVQYQ